MQIGWIETERPKMIQNEGGVRNDVKYHHNGEVIDHQMEIDVNAARRIFPANF